MPLHKRKEDTTRFRNVKENFTDEDKKWTAFAFAAVVLVGVSALLIFFKRRENAKAAFRGMKFY